MCPAAEPSASVLVGLLEGRGYRLCPLAGTSQIMLLCMFFMSQDGRGRATSLSLGRLCANTVFLFRFASPGTWVVVMAAWPQGRVCYAFVWSGPFTVPPRGCFYDAVPFGRNLLESTNLIMQR